jgi:hypothetical protein
MTLIGMGMVSSAFGLPAIGCAQGPEQNSVFIAMDLAFPDRARARLTWAMRELERFEQTVRDNQKADGHQHKRKRIITICLVSSIRSERVWPRIVDHADIRGGSPSILYKQPRGLRWLRTTEHWYFSAQL